MMVNFEIFRGFHVNVTMNVKDRQQLVQRDLRFWSCLSDYIMYIFLSYIKKQGRFFSFG